MDSFIALQHFHFLRPYWFIALILIVVVLRQFTRRDDTLGVWRKAMSPEVLKQLTIEGNSRHWLSPQKLSICLAIPVCVVLMGPTWKQQPSPFTENKAALIIALDVSQTMEQSDIQPNRLLRAKQKILELLELRGDTHTALIAYAGSAHTVMPMTNDREMIRHFLDVLEPKLMPIQGKLPEKVLPISKALFEPSMVPGTLLLIGDGATTETSDKFSDFFKKQSHQLIVWAIGVDAKHIESASSIIPMQLGQLQNLVDKSRGRLVTMSSDNKDVERVQGYIENNLVIVDDKSRPWYDSGYPLVFLVALLFLFWFRRGWTLQW